MADTAASAATVSPGFLPGLVNMPMLRQIAVILVFAATVSLGVALVFWLQEPNYAVLFNEPVAIQDISTVLQTLEQAEIKYRQDARSGVIMVPTGQLYKARMLLAAQGLPEEKPEGYALLDGEVQFGTSRMKELSLHKRAQEGELAMMVSSLANIKSAKVHLAVPKQSVFARKRHNVSASVVVHLYPGRSLRKQQVAAIVHLIASSVPRLEPGRVTVVDNRGKLLNAEEADENLAVSSKQFDYQHTVEKDYMRRIEGILTPFLGERGVQAQVAVELDFTQSEQTQERYDPDTPALRSEQLMKDDRSSGGGASGIPGTLSNTPPGGGTAPETAGGAGGGDGASGSGSNSQRSVKNYELNRTVQHLRKAVGTVRRLSVAVVVDYRRDVDKSGNVTSKPRSTEEMDRIKKLVMDAVGFSALRGDSVNITNESFVQEILPEAMPPLEIWELPQFAEWVRFGTTMLLVTVLIFFVLVPAMKRLLKHEELPPLLPAEPQQAQPSLEQLTLPQQEEVARLTGPSDYDKRLDTAKKVVDEDPKRVAQLMKTWLALDGGS